MTLHSSGLAILILGICLMVPLIALFMRRAFRENRALSWPSTEATIQSAGVKTIGTGRYSVDLPCFAFSYAVDGEYYSGRFALDAKGDRADTLVKELINKKLTMQYDPTRPSSYSIPDEWIEGCEVRLVPD